MGYEVFYYKNDKKANEKLTLDNKTILTYNAYKADNVYSVYLFFSSSSKSYASESCT